MSQPLNPLQSDQAPIDGVYPSNLPIKFDLSATQGTITEYTVTAVDTATGLPVTSMQLCGAMTCVFSESPVSLQIDDVSLMFQHFLVYFCDLLKSQSNPTILFIFH